MEAPLVKIDIWSIVTQTVCLYNLNPLENNSLICLKPNSLTEFAILWHVLL